jgi:hypothetical protein
LTIPNDPQLLTLRFAIAGVVTLDPDRLEDDPVWQMISARYDLTSGEGRRQALAAYLTRYLEREQLLAQNPCTNGPATPTGIEIEFP